MIHHHYLLIFLRAFVSIKALIANLEQNLVNYIFIIVELNHLNSFYFTFTHLEDYIKRFCLFVYQEHQQDCL